MTVHIHLAQPDDHQAIMPWIGEVLGEQSRAAGHPWAPKAFAFEAKQEDMRIGAIAGQRLYDWVWIMLLAVVPEARGSGTGSTLVKAAEGWGRERDALGVHVETFAYQAPHFYERLGYQEISRLAGRTAGEDRIFFAKRFDGILDRIS